MLVRPRGVSSRRMDDSINRVHPDEVPGINRRATLARVTGHSGRVKREPCAIGPAARSAVELRLIDADAFLVFGSSANGRFPGIAFPPGYTVPCCVQGWIK